MPQGRITASWIYMKEAVAARPGWSVAALILAIAALVVMPCDAGIQAAVHAWRGLPGVDTLSALVRPFGRGEVVALVALLVAASGRRRLGGQILLGLAVVAALTWILKTGVGRVRPNGDPFSFVSGDTSSAWALLPLLVRSWSGLLGGVLLAGAVGLVRIVDGYHWPSDVLAGAAVGLAGCILGARLWPARPWAILADRRTWIWLAAAAMAGAIGLAWSDPGPMRIFVQVWAPPLLALAVWGQLRPRLRRLPDPPAWMLGLMALVFAGVLFWLAASHTLLDRDEPRNAEAAREMVASGDYLVPTLNHELRLHKPILPYWLMTGALRCGLPPDLACRLPAVLCMALVVLLTALTARRLALTSGAPAGRTGLVTALALATSPFALVCGSAATTDAALLLGIATVMWLLVESICVGLRWWHIVLAGPALGWALLSKGPMGLLVPVATLVVAVAITAIQRWRRQEPAPASLGRGPWLVLASAVLVGGGLALAWFLAANRATDGQVYKEMILNQVVDRAFAPRESHGGGPWYYLPILVAGFIAWLPALASALRQAAGRMRDRTTIILLAWALPVFVAVTLVQTKLPHYLLPMFPPLAIMIAFSLGSGGADGWWRWGWRIQAGLLGLVATALVLAPLGVLAQSSGFIELPLPLANLAAPALAAGLGMWVLLSVLSTVAGAGRRGAYAIAAVIGMTALVAALALNVHALEAYKPSPRAAAVVRKHAQPGVPIAVCGFEEASLLFAIGPERAPVAVLGKTPKALRQWATLDGPGVCVTTVERYELALKDSPGIRVLATIKPGFNYANGSVVRLIVLGRHLPE